RSFRSRCASPPSVPYSTLCLSLVLDERIAARLELARHGVDAGGQVGDLGHALLRNPRVEVAGAHAAGARHDRLHGPHEAPVEARSEEHTSELQSRENLVCRLLL